MRRATYRVVRELAISETPCAEDYRTYKPGDAIELGLDDAVQLMRFRFVVQDDDSTLVTAGAPS